MITRHGLVRSLRRIDTLALSFGAMIGWSRVALAWPHEWIMVGDWSVLGVAFERARPARSRDEHAHEEPA